MELKDKKYFYFTQNSLNTFKNCPFKFKKKYIDNVKWQDEENNCLNEHAEFGVDFHKIAERYFGGIPVFEESFKDNEELYNAFCNLREYFPINDEFKYYPEYTIRYSAGDVRLEANIDLIIEKENSIEILDWKTNAQNDSEKYEKSLQTKIYMFVLKKCMKHLFNKDFYNIRMVYFSPERKEEIANVVYSEERYKEDEAYLTDLINGVYNFSLDKFNKSLYAKHCKFCEFKLFCESSHEETKYEFGRLNWNDIEEFY